MAEGDAQGRRCVRFGSTLNVGRHPSNDLVLADERASRFHALLELGPRGWRVRDLGSKNGSSLNDQPLEDEQPLRPGDQLCFGGRSRWKVLRLTERGEQDDCVPTADLPPEAEPRMSLRAVDDGQQIEFGGLLTIGRHPSNGLVLDSELISGHHAVIAFREGRWRLRDLGSRNATSSGGRRLQGWRDLVVGQRIRFGGCSSWEVVAAQQPGQEEGFQPTVEERQLPELRLTLTWDGDYGFIKVEQQGVTWIERAGQPFLLLHELARRPGQWVDDDELKSALWGLAARRRSRTALGTIIFHTRRIFASHGISGSIVEKDGKRTARTRLRLPPERVRVFAGRGGE